MVEPDNEEVPIGAALPGITLEALPGGWQPIGVCVLIKCLDEEGTPLWAFRTSEALSSYEVLGALAVRTDMFRQDLVRLFDDE